jgi:hypothetical protein
MLCADTALTRSIWRCARNWRSAMGASGGEVSLLRGKTSHQTTCFSTKRLSGESNRNVSPAAGKRYANVTQTHINAPAQA